MWMYENGAFCWLESISLAYQKTHPGLSRERQHLKWKLGEASMLCWLSHFIARGGNKEYTTKEVTECDQGLWEGTRCCWMRANQALCAGAQVWGVMDAYALRRPEHPVLWLCCSWAPRDDWLGVGGRDLDFCFNVFRAVTSDLDRLWYLQRGKLYVPVKEVKVAQLCSDFATPWTI